MMPHPPPPPPDLLIPLAILRSKDVGWAAKIVFAALWRCTDESGFCRQSLSQLCLLLNMANRTLRDAMSELVKAGMATPLRTPGHPTRWLVTNPHRYGETRADTALPTRADTALPLGRIPPSPPSQAIEEWAPLPKPPDRTARLCPDEFRPAQRTLDWCLKHWPKVDCERELGLFIAYFQEQGVKRPGWDKSFMTWVGKAGDSPARATAPGGARAASLPRLTPTGEQLKRYATGETTLRGSGRTNDY